MFTIIQDMQRKVNEMYVDWKAAGFGSSQVENNTKWINVRIEHYLINFSQNNTINIYRTQSVKQFMLNLKRSNIQMMNA